MNRDLIKDLVANKSQHISLKKSNIKLSKGGLSMVVYNKTTSTDKDNNNSGSLKVKIVGNTYLYLDSQDDVLAKSVFSKSLKERGKNAFHLVDHEFKLTARIGDPTKIYEDTITWKELGVEKEGDANVLIMESDVKKEYNERIYNDYKKGIIQQHSVGLRYTDLQLAVNDDSFDEEYKIWNDVIDSIGNKAEAEKLGFFWYVKQAELVEVSAVLAASNPITPTLPIDEPSKDTQKEVERSLQKEQKQFFINQM